ncbi:protein kinase domain-containing protein [Enterobacter cloacae]|uniref:protein kinase domain-containing protein n=1 Tax=Enterobacter cloacae TaxID=550 RepID=UPI002004C0EB|nr:protein kinase [Enterobacter cloacae]MCK7339741.1 protein kinase [Enterobacter cloacae]
MSAAFFFLKKLDLLNINGYCFLKALNNGSALSAVYSDGKEKVVIKFLVNPRNWIELERFKLEFSVLKCNYINSFYSGEGYIFRGEEDETYPLPKIKIDIYHSQDNFINYFGYKYEEGILLADYDTSTLSVRAKFVLISRIASALNYFNMCGYVHRDLHPKNILLLDNPKMNALPPIPRVIILDLGNCQKNKQHFELEYMRLTRGLDEDAVFNDNNKRILSSFTSMPPDFLIHGEETKNYDAWAIGIYCYELLFNRKPFDFKGIKHVANVLNSHFHPLFLDKNLKTLRQGEKLVIESLLNVDGNKRPSTDAIIRLINYILESDFFCDNFEGLAEQIIKNDGFDPYARPDE